MKPLVETLNDMITEKIIALECKDAEIARLKAKMKALLSAYDSGDAGGSMRNIAIPALRSEVEG